MDILGTNTPKPKKRGPRCPAGKVRVVKCRSLTSVERGKRARHAKAQCKASRKVIRDLKKSGVIATRTRKS